MEITDPLLVSDQPTKSYPAFLRVISEMTGSCRADPPEVKTREAGTVPEVAVLALKVTVFIQAAYNVRLPVSVLVA